jgi:hypothetical protein
MAKKLDDLHLSDAPITSHGGTDWAEERKQADKWAGIVQDLLDDDKHNFAWGFLMDVKLTIEKTGRVTGPQIQAIKNVQEGADRGEETRERNRRSRRYEGWSR